MVRSSTLMVVSQVAGVASPSAIKFAIMTMTDMLDNNDKPILNEQYDEATTFAMGASHINASRATDLGLVYALGASDT
nr:unnamed protein product [Digitaria exilis]CAB3483753.1 unnamed protein product [Digitaria exilis]